MRKNDLITLLESVKGNPEIMVWNGFVEDFQPLAKTLNTAKLQKLTLQGYKERVNWQMQMDGKQPFSDDKISELYKQHKIGEWGYSAYYPPGDDDEHYKVKTVYILEPKLAGKTYSDRLGSIEY
ncbi:MAG: hypothetical protein Tp178MES00d2C33159851_40 [Prokaryotic dsDNA virus sp.]|nr:MAG: hypothetical protein Tp178MES00d2C33159851_40 [Prokaryotic dsDNA virus sp.]|tara:strand:+ start:77229 stop:77600 length:372 start_codon:yes stop_codon:yes gene_type:complete